MSTFYHFKNLEDYSINANDARLSKKLDEFKLSFRTTHCLKNANIIWISDLVKKTEADLLNLPNFGRKSLNEINEMLDSQGLSLGLTVLGDIDYTKQEEIIPTTHENTLPAEDVRLLKNVNELDLSIRSINCLKNDKIEYIGDLVQKTEADMLKTPNFGRTSLEEIRKQLSVLGLSFGMEVPGWPPENLNELLQQHKENYSVSFEQCLKEIEDYIQTKCTDIEKSVFNQRIKQVHGATLQALAEDINVTRERIRQIETKIMDKILRIFSKNISFLNDIITKFGSIVDYSVDNNDEIILIRQNSELLYNLFKNRSNYSIDLKKQWLCITSDLPSFSINDSNLYSMDELVEHISSILSNILKNDTIEAKKNFNSILNKYIKQIIIDNFIFIDGKRTENTKSAVFRRFLSQYSLMPMDIDFLFKEYSAFLIHNNIDLKKYGYPKFTTFSNMIADRDDVLLSLGHKVRYYNCNAVDIKRLKEQLNLSDYKDVEISCNKLFDENKELMVDYNILNAHELHNLLKKRCKTDEADFSRMPIIRFGNADRAKQVINFARTLAPVSTTDLATAYEEAFGIHHNTFIANYAQYLRDYIYRGQVIFDDNKQISEIEKNKILLSLTKDFYFIHDVENLFKGIFADNYHEYMQQAILKSVGFYMTPLYILSTKYASLRDYINQTFDNMSILDLNVYKEYKALGAFENWFYNKRNNSDLIKFAYNKYISSAALEQVGITKHTLTDYTQHVLKRMKNRFFTVYSISNMLENFELDTFGFEDVFYEDVLIQHADISFTKINNVVLFKNTSDPISLGYFITSLMEHFRSINIYDLILKIREEYGISLGKYDITRLTDETDLYYNNITESLYINYDEFITSF